MSGKRSKENQKKKRNIQEEFVKRKSRLVERENGEQKLKDDAKKWTIRKKI